MIRTREGTRQGVKEEHRQVRDYVISKGKKFCISERKWTGRKRGSDGGMNTYTDKDIKTHTHTHLLKEMGVPGGGVCNETCQLDFSSRTQGGQESPRPSISRR